MKQPTIIIHQLSQMLEKMTAAAPAVLSAPAQYHHLQYLKIRWLKHFRSLNQLVILDKKTVEELQWWSDHQNTWNRRDIIQSPPDLVIEIGTSLLGWGVVCNGVQTGCQWSQEKQWEYINGLELMVGIFAMQAVAKDKQNVHIYLRMDNTLSLSYVTGWRTHGLPYLQKWLASCGTGGYLSRWPSQHHFF